MNWKTLLNNGPTSKGDIVLAVGAFIVAGIKAVVTIQDYKSESKENEK